ncbi:uncharacterized protein ARMOST_10083 [Armillaria ostoyae]|uniref:Retrotransposon gag domain-containing protein n=1 Tax=Armillaria ostoyae TaxID=47428 RepID=A0A284RDB1_ARMOS|nr:uncharacterized protein ARMOST_10083 [Armillaria ostoyae]
MVPFVASHFEGPAKDWWVHKRQEFWWTEFVQLINEQFCDPAIEEVHKKKMFNLQMGNGAATTYFQELERLAKLAGRSYDQGERGVIIKAVHLRVRESYTKFIAMMGFNMPHTYPEWKARILAMYKEQQKKWVFDQTTSMPHESQPPPATPKQVA